MKPKINIIYQHNQINKIIGGQNLDFFFNLHCRDELTEVEVLRKKVKQKSNYNQRSIQTPAQASSNHDATWRLFFNYANHLRLKLLSSSDGVLLYYV
ncbi:hypothetical protein T11_14960 [Trichinella zimbabwensis]|uniref:Uncharacterized protein n=1 Tax=Trichinella zimbabwensis TaxID=268475 RepID=A0A0V1GVS0_9BILA|nr:hypothetical protein T11_14960 [Trichinella zimbabwensis]